MLLYYAKGIGVVAIGEIISDVSNVVEDENNKELYRMVILLAPSDIPVHENELRAISAKRLKEIVDHGFYFASTVKSPFLSEHECNLLLSKLRSLYE